MKRRVISGVVGLTILAIFFILSLSLAVVAIRSTDSDLTVTFLDVGQGDATLIETPSGTQVLIDGGRPRSVERPLARQLPFYDRSIDMIIATHADSDHIGGLVDVLKNYQVDLIGVPVLKNETAAYDAFLKAAAAEVARDGFVSSQELTRGDVVHLDDGAYLLTLFPLAKHQPENLNESSTVFKLIYGDTSVILTGDSTQAIEEYLASIDGGLLQADILKVGHHGSDTSSSEIFLSAVSPEVAVISAGSDNTYGHPADTVLARLIAVGAETLCTCDLGTVTLVSDGREVRHIE